MTTEEKYSYEIGPSDAMKKEIGQIVINHAYCETALRGLLVAIAGWDQKTANTVLKTFNPKGDAIRKAIESLLKGNTLLSPTVVDRINSIGESFKTLSHLRNTIAHWHWGMCDPETPESAIVSNFTYGFHPSGQDKTFTLNQLKEIGIDLAGIVSAAFLLRDFVIDAGQSEKEVQGKLLQFDSIMAKVRKSVLRLPEEPEDDEHA